MLTLLTIVGLLFLALAGYGIFLRFTAKMSPTEDVRQISQNTYNDAIHDPEFKDKVYEENGKYYYRETIPASPAWMITLARTWVFALVLGLPLTLTTQLFYYAESGNYYFVEHLNGKVDAWMDQGFKLKMFAPKVQVWPKYIDIKAPLTPTDKNGNPTGTVDVSDLEGVMKPVPIRFIDQVTALMYPSTRFELPKDRDSFITMAIKFKTVNNLVYHTLIPTIEEQANNTGYMFAAQDYISGASQEFRQTFDEQLKDGAYQVRKKEYHDTTYYTAIDQKGTDRGIRNISVRYEVEKLKSKDGKFIRIPNEIVDNNILVSQVLVPHLEPDPEYQERLKQQKEESAKRQLEQQKTETAKIAQQRVIAEGEQQKAAERVVQETEQVKQLIAIETKLKQERTNKELADIAYQTAQVKAKTVKVEADAKAYELSRADGLSAEVQFTEEQKTKRALALADAIKNANFPSTYIEGGGTNGKAGENSLIESLLGVSLVKQLQEGNNKK